MLDNKHPLCDPGRLSPLAKQTLDDYGKYGLPPGECFLAILRNDIFAAMKRASDDTIAALPAIVHYIQTQLPSGSYGSAAAVELWIEERRAARIAAGRLEVTP